jgi:enamine deaminase RidA (YjgF/YER057c/UK114 family)
MRARVQSRAPFETLWGYSRAIRVADRIEVSGTSAIHPDGSVHAPGDAYEQTRYVIGIIDSALTELGSSLTHVVRTRAYLVHIDDWKEVGRAHLQAFGTTLPASTCVGGAVLLDPGLLVEIEATAVIPNGEPA